MQREPRLADRSTTGPTYYWEAEVCLRRAGQLLEHVGVTDLEAARLARVIFRMAQRVAVDSGRLESAA